MKNNKHIHDEDYDFSIKLMAPLLSILVCTICLCATTWAWYTASVSTGVTSITAKANVSESVSCGDDCSVQKTGNEYVLEAGSYTLSFTYVGDAEYGYFALIDLEDSVDSQTNTASIIDLLVNRVYVEESEAQVQAINNKGYFYINKSIQNLSFPIIVDSEKVLKIQYVWGIKADGSNDVILEEKYASYQNEINATNGISLIEEQSVEPATITFNYINAATGESLPYSTLGIESYGLRENEEELPQTATIVYEANGEEIEIFAPKGYLLEKNDSFNEKEDVENRVYRIETDEDVVINVSCVPIAQDNSDDIETENTSESDNEVTGITPPVIENSSDEAEKPDTDSSDATDQNNSSEITNTDETEHSDINTEKSDVQPIESLLITDSTDEEKKETTPSSDETNSETDDVSE